MIGNLTKYCWFWVDLIDTHALAAESAYCADSIWPTNFGFMSSSRKCMTPCCHLPQLTHVQLVLMFCANKLPVFQSHK